MPFTNIMMAATKFKNEVAGEPVDRTEYRQTASNQSEQPSVQHLPPSYEQSITSEDYGVSINSEASDSTISSLRPLQTGNNLEGYKRNEEMKWQQLERSGHWRKYDSKPGCCFSRRGACCWSDHGACCFSDREACCFSDRRACCFSDRGACCWSDHSACCFGGHDEASQFKCIPSCGTLL